MSLEIGLLLTVVIVIVIVVPAGIGMAGFLMWLQYRDSETNHHNGDGMTSEMELKL